jgi:protein O-mannosyl-transferase
MAKYRDSNKKLDTAKKSISKEAKPAAPKAQENMVQKPKEVQTLSPFTNTKLHLILIFVLSFLLYGNTITHDYALDDSIVIIENEFTKQGIAGIGDILKYDTFVGFFGKKKDLVAGGRYRPMSLVTFALEWQFFGQNPMVSHFVNILLYGLTSAVLYLLMLLMFKNIRPPLEAYFIAIATTALFLTHPIHTEAVANIKGRDEIMALLGSLTALYWTFQYVHSKNILYLFGAIAVYFLGLLSKENTITFLAILPLALYFFSEKANIQSVIIKTAPFLVTAIVFLFIRSNVLGEAGNIGGEEAQELMNNPFVGLSFSERYGTIFYTLGKYIQLLIFPHPLTHDYYPRHIEVMSLSDWQALLSIGIYVAMGLYALVRLPKKDPYAFGIIFYLASLSVVSNLVFSVGTNMSERLVFMPSVGFCLIIALLLNHFLSKKDNFKMAFLATAVIGALFLGKTFQRNYAWKDNFTLFSTDIKTSIHSAKLNNAMGGSLIDKASEPNNQLAAAEKEKMLNDAILYLNKAVEAHPTYENAYNQFGRVYYAKGDYDKAAEYFRYLVTTFGSADGKKNLYETAKAISDIKKDYVKVIPIFEEVKAYFPNDVELYGYLGAAYGNTNQPYKAIEQFEKITQIDPNNARAYLFIGYTYANLGQSTGNSSYVQKGNEYINKAKSIDPNIK